MNNVPEKHLEVAHAWVDGAEVEFEDDGEWFSCSTPTWYDHMEYRIKPKAKLKLWKWLTSTNLHYTEVEAANLGFHLKVADSMIEVDAK